MFKNVRIESTGRKITTLCLPTYHILTSITALTSISEIFRVSSFIFLLYLLFSHKFVVTDPERYPANFGFRVHSYEGRCIQTVEFHSLGREHPTRRDLSRRYRRCPSLRRYFRERIPSISHRYRGYLGATARARSHDKTAVSNRRGPFYVHSV